MNDKTKPTPVPPCVFDRDTSRRPSEREGWTGVFEARDSWVPSLASRLARIEGKDKPPTG